MDHSGRTKRLRLAYMSCGLLVLVLIAIGAVVYFARQTKYAPTGGSVCGKWMLVGGETKLVPLYPDTHSQYWLWNFARDTTNENVAFRITGQFPHARFASFQTYGEQESATLPDFEIVPDKGSVNPSQPGAPHDAPNRSYTILFVPPGSSRIGQPNTLTMPAGETSPNVVLRIYRRDRQYEHGGPLPKIEAFDDRSGKPVACPGPGTLKTFLVQALSGISTAVEEMPPVENPLHFYRLSGAGFAPNASNVYLGAHLPLPAHGDIAAVRFKMPVFPDTYHNSHVVLTAKDDVRYMSLCISGVVSTLTSACAADDELKTDREGFANVIIGPDDTRARKAALARGYTYLSWDHIIEPIILFRQMLARQDFSGSAVRVPVYDSGKPGAGQSAEHFMGPYAPVGRLCPLEEFISGSKCGLPG